MRYLGDAAPSAGFDLFPGLSTLTPAQRVELAGAAAHMTDDQAGTFALMVDSSELGAHRHRMTQVELGIAAIVGAVVGVVAWKVLT